MPVEPILARSVYSSPGSESFVVAFVGAMDFVALASSRADVYRAGLGTSPAGPDDTALGAAAVVVEDNFVEVAFD